MTLPDGLFEIEDIYKTEDIFTSEAIWNFSYRINSINRYWNLNKDFNASYIDSLLKKKDILESGDYGAEYFDAFSETHEVDIDFFPSNLRGYIVSISISALENMLAQLAGEIAKELGKKIDLDNRKIPFINKYILWFTKDCKMNFSIPKSLNKSLDTIREIRNRFLHNINRDIPDYVKKTMVEMTKELDNGNEINDVFVDESLEKLCVLVKKIEISHIDFFSKKN